MSSGKCLRDKRIDGVYSAEVPPVPIPNTVVKLSSAEDTWWVAARENRTMPSQTIQQNGLFFMSFVVVFIVSL